MNNIYEGQEVYYQYWGHRPNDNREPTATIVTKVGRKWFEVRDCKYTRFSIETLENDGRGYIPTSRIILSMLDYRNELEHNYLYKNIQEYFEMFSRKTVTLDQLRRIADVLNIEQNDERSVATKDKSR